jgi:hypothetical protein
MNDMIDGEYRFELVLNDPALSNAKGMQWQARCEQSTRWTWIAPVATVYSKRTSCS